MKFKKILLIGGTHGNERTGVDLTRMLGKHPIEFITPILANPKAVEKNIRFIETDLNRSVGKRIGISYEEQLANSLEAQIKKSELVIEFHNTTSLNNTCAIITQKPNSLHKLLAYHFEIDKLLIMPPAGSLSGLNSKKFFSLEVSNDDYKFTDIKYLTSRLRSLKSNLASGSGKIRTYAHTGITVNISTLQRLKIPIDKLRNFKRFSKETYSKLGLPENKNYSPAFIGEEAYGKEFGFILVEETKA